MRYEHSIRDWSEARIRLFFLLCDIARDNPAYSLTIEELARRARVALDDVLPELKLLEDESHITRTKSKITQVGEVACSLKFTTKIDTSVATLVEENTLLQSELRELREGTYDTLPDRLENEGHAKVARLASEVLGRSLRSEEIYYLGGITHVYGIPRVFSQLQKQRRAKNPLKAVYAILSRGGSGKPIQRDTTEESVEYYEPEEGSSPWA